MKLNYDKHNKNACSGASMSKDQAFDISNMQENKI